MYDAVSGETIEEQLARTELLAAGQRFEAVVTRKANRCGWALLKSSSVDPLDPEFNTYGLFDLHTGVPLNGQELVAGLGTYGLSLAELDALLQTPASLSSSSSRAIGSSARDSAAMGQRTSALDGRLGMAVDEPIDLVAQLESATAHLESAADTIETLNTTLEATSNQLEASSVQRLERMTQLVETLSERVAALEAENARLRQALGQEAGGGR